MQVVATNDPVHEVMEHVLKAIALNNVISFAFPQVFVVTHTSE